MKSIVVNNVCEAYDAVARDEDRYDIAVVESGNTGRTLFYILGNTEPPPGVQALPGYRLGGVTGIPGPMVSYYECYRTTAEIMAAIPTDDEVPEMDWTRVVERNPQGYLELNNGQVAIHGPLEKIEIDDRDWVVVTLKWRAQVTLGPRGVPNGDWVAVANDLPIIFSNLTVPYEIEEIPGKGPRVRFGLNILYLNAVEGLDPSRIVGFGSIAPTEIEIVNQ